MNKKIQTHEKFIKTEIEKLEYELKCATTKEVTDLIHKDAEKLYRYHQDVVCDSQHERLIHLIVTFFFAGLLLLSIITLFLFTILTAAYDFNLLTTLIIAVSLILFITEIFYIKHYYALENGTQRLYKFSKKLYEISR